MIFTSHSIFYENMMYDNSCTKVNQFFFFFYVGFIALSEGPRSLLRKKQCIL